MSIITPAPVRLTAAAHRFFDDLVTALGAHAALTAGYVTHAQHTAYRFLDDWTMRLGCFTRRENRSILEVELTPASILTPLTQFSWPASLDLKFGVVTDVSDPPPPPRPPFTAPLIGMTRMTASLFEHAFVTYYERYAEEIYQARNQAGSGGLPTLDFARAVRNGFAHGGVVHLTRDGQSASWSGLTYTRQENGRQIMGNDLSQGDVILLMLEMDGLF